MTVVVDLGPRLSNDCLAEHVTLLGRSYHHYTGRELFDPVFSPAKAARAIWIARFAVVSHTTDPDPLFNYANEMALKLFELSWDQFIGMPSRLSAEPLAREDRNRLLAAVAAQGYVDDYTGVRISSSGRRFIIRDATVWNLSDEHGCYRGQAACLRHWERLGE